MAQVTTPHDGTLSFGDASALVISDGELMDIIRDMDNNWMLDLKPPSDLPSSDVPATSIKKKRTRRNGREDIMKCRQELVNLQNQLQILQRKHELKATKSSSGVNWEVVTLREKMKCKTAINENSRLRKLVQSKARLIQRISRLAYRQEMAVPEFVRFDCRIADIENQAQVYRVMQACLDIRSQGALEDIVNQCVQNAEAAYKLRKYHWRTFALSDQSVGVEFCESVVMPFSSSFIHSVLYRYPEVINALKIRENKFVEKISKKPIPSHIFSQSTQSYVATASDRQLVLRRLVSVKNQPILLWEDASCWQRDGNSPPVLVRGSGWGVITPAPYHDNDLSIIYTGSMTQIYTIDGSSLSPTDQLTAEAVEHMKSLQRSRITSVEDVLLNATSRQQRG